MIGKRNWANGGGKGAAVTDRPKSFMQILKTVTADRAVFPKMSPSSLVHATPENFPHSTAFHPGYGTAYVQKYSLE